MGEVSPRSESPPGANRAHRNKWIRVRQLAAVFVVGYLLIAYVLMPIYWRQYAYRHPAIDETPGVTMTADKHPGDPINIALVGSEADVKRVMAAAEWIAADPLGLKSDLRIAADTVLNKPFQAAPVSNLYLFGRKEDLAFEQAVGDNPRQRHHVRFWKSAKVDSQGRPLWAGSATYDERVGLSHTTGQITHHIAPDIDAERNHLLANLQYTHEVSIDYIDGFHKVLTGHNGGGDRWFTDGRLPIVEIKAEQ